MRDRKHSLTSAMLLLAEVVGSPALKQSLKERVLAPLADADMIEITLRAAERIQLAEKLQHPPEFAQAEYKLARTMPAQVILAKHLETYRKRRAAYGPSEQRFADVCVAMFPGGLSLRTRTEWLRWGLLCQIISKLARYAHSFSNPHVDSMHDISPYAAMLEAEDRRFLGMAPFDVGEEVSLESSVLHCGTCGDVASGYHVTEGDRCLEVKCNGRYTRGHSAIERD